MKEKLTHEQKLEKRRCYFQGDIITSIEELVKYDFVYCRGKIYQKGWVLSWQLKMVLDYLNKGYFRYAHKKEGYKTYMEKKLESVEPELDRNELRKIFIDIYANPVKAKEDANFL